MMFSLDIFNLKKKKEVLKKCNITVPNVEEMCEIVEYLACNVLERSMVTDYAVARGAKTVDYSIKGGYMNLGPVWTRNVSQKEPHQLVVVDSSIRRNRYANRQFNRVGKALGDYMFYYDNVSVMPRIQNPEALGFGLTDLDDQMVLTMNDKLTYWPQKNSPLKKGELSPDQKVGNYNGLNCYQYQGSNYVVMPNELVMADREVHFSDGQVCQPNAKEQYYFQNQPIRAMRCKDGSIQCLDGLFPSYIGKDWREYSDRKHDYRPGQEIDLNEFYLGRLLNDKFVRCLEMSTKFVDEKVNHKLSKLNISTNKDQNIEIVR